VSVTKQKDSTNRAYFTLEKGQAHMPPAIAQAKIGRTVAAPTTAQADILIVVVDG
jgi:hypothetical protein